MNPSFLASASSSNGNAAIGRQRPVLRTHLLLLFAVVIGTMSTNTHAYKDDSYYMAGSGNPNTHEKMYWKDADNVLQDLSQFKSLYVQFHNCAWTWMYNENEEADNDVEENGTFWWVFQSICLSSREMSIIRLEKIKE